MGFVSESGARSEAGLLSCLCLRAERPLPPCEGTGSSEFRNPRSLLQGFVPLRRASVCPLCRAAEWHADLPGRGELALQMSRCPSARNVRRINPPPPEHHRRRTLSPKTQGVRLSSLQLRARPICASSPALPFPQKNLGSSRRGQVP